MKTITLEDDEFNEVCNVLQLMTVCNIRLNMVGRGYPKHTILERAFDKFAGNVVESAQAKPEGTPESKLAEVRKILPLLRDVGGQAFLNWRALLLEHCDELDRVTK